VADAVWVAAATLQREAGETRAFSTEDIVSKVAHLGITKGQSKSIWQHVNQHCVANRKAQPNRLCYLYATGGGQRRLCRASDRRDPSREGAAMHPAWERLPERFADLRRWYEQEWTNSGALPESDPLLDLIGSGATIWAHEHADEYVASLRADWGEAQ
jgi:hypothetical protein